MLLVLGERGTRAPVGGGKYGVVERRPEVVDRVADREREFGRVVTLVAARVPQCGRCDDRSFCQW